MNFQIPTPVLPTEEQHRAASTRWLGRIRPFLYENWPDALKALSFRTAMVELTRSDIEALMPIFDGQFGESLDAVVAKVDDAILAFDPEGCFLRLSSRSPKDSYAWGSPTKTRTGRDFIETFANSMRMIEDLIEYRYADARCYLLLREHAEIPPPEEWRCFVRDGKVVGISQYEHRTYFPEVARDREIEARIREFLARRVMPAMAVDAAAVDLWMGEEAALIEINPYGLSDPCLFHYEELDRGDCGFRVVTANQAEGRSGR